MRSPPPTPPPADAAATVAALRAQFEALQREFARYFEGLERVAPLAARDAFVAALRQAQLMGRGSSAARFQLQNLRASWAVHAPRYERALAQMEAGTYVPQHRRGATTPRSTGHGAASGRATPPAHADGADGPAPLVAGGGAEHAADAAEHPAAAALRDGTRPTPAVVAAYPPAAAELPPPAASDALVRLHAAWAAAAAPSGARVPSREALAAVVAHKIAEVRAHSGQRQVEVRVVVEHGVPVLQVVPKPG